MDGSSYETELPALLLAPRGRREPQMAFRGRRRDGVIECYGSSPDCITCRLCDPGYGLELSEPLHPHLRVGVTVAHPHRGCEDHRRWDKTWKNPQNSVSHTVAA